MLEVVRKEPGVKFWVNLRLCNMEHAKGKGLGVQSPCLLPALPLLKLPIQEPLVRNLLNFAPLAVALYLIYLSSHLNRHA